MAAAAGVAVGSDYGELYISLPCLSICSLLFCCSLQFRVYILVFRLTFTSCLFVITLLAACDACTPLNCLFVGYTSYYFS